MEQQPLFLSPNLSEKKKKVTIFCYGETVIQMGCDFYFQIILFFLNTGESNSILNYMTGCIRAWLVTHLCIHMGLCEMKHSWIQDFQDL